MEKFIGIKEVSVCFGIKESTVYAWVHTRQIPFYKIGRLVKFKVADIEKWLEEKKVEMVNCV